MKDLKKLGEFYLFILEINTYLVLRVKYGKGEMMTSEVKKELIQCLTKIVGEHQVIYIKFSIFFQI